MATSDDPKTAARDIITRGTSGSLGTAMVGSGAPYVSLTTIAVGKDLQPVFLLSALAEHTKNLAETNSASLLIEQASHLKNPQTGPRATLLGAITETQDKADSDLFLATHPSAKTYAGFEDFRFFKMQVEKVHYVGGFAAAHWFALEDFNKRI